MDFDPVLLARLQFAFTISFHIIFPSFTIGLSAYVATLEILWGLTGADRYNRLAAFWTKIFAVSFGMGVLSGVVLSRRRPPTSLGWWPLCARVGMTFSSHAVALYGAWLMWRGTLEQTRWAR